MMMANTHKGRRRLTGWAAAATLSLALGTVLGAALATAAPMAAQAHNYLVSSTPAEGEVLTSLPDEFSITTNDALLDLGEGAGGFGLQVIDAEGLYYNDGCVTVDGPSMSARAALGAPGPYTIIWQVVSIDGHTVSGELSFVWQPDDISQSSAGSATVPVCGQENVEETSAPEATEEPTAPSPEKSAPDASADEPVSSDLLWIGGAIVAVVVAAGVTMLVLGRRKG